MDTDAVAVAVVAVVVVVVVGVVAAVAVVDHFHGAIVVVSLRVVGVSNVSLVYDKRHHGEVIPHRLDYNHCRVVVDELSYVRAILRRKLAVEVAVVVVVGNSYCIVRDVRDDGVVSFLSVIYVSVSLLLHFGLPAELFHREMFHHWCSQSLEMLAPDH